MRQAKGIPLTKAAASSSATSGTSAVSGMLGESDSVWMASLPFSAWAKVAGSTFLVDEWYLASGFPGWRCSSMGIDGLRLLGLSVSIRRDGAEARWRRDPPNACSIINEGYFSLWQRVSVRVLGFLGRRGARKSFGNSGLFFGHGEASGM